MSGITREQFLAGRLGRGIDGAVFDRALSTNRALLVRRGVIDVGTNGAVVVLSASHLREMLVQQAEDAAGVFHERGAQTPRGADSQSLPRLMHR